MKTLAAILIIFFILIAESNQEICGSENSICGSQNAIVEPNLNDFPQYSNEELTRSGVGPIIYQWVGFIYAWGDLWLNVLFLEMILK